MYRRQFSFWMVFMTLKGTLRMQRGSFPLHGWRFGATQVWEKSEWFSWYITDGRFLDFLYSWMPSAHSEYTCGCLQVFVVLRKIWMVYQTLRMVSRKLNPNLKEKSFYSIFKYPSLCGQVQTDPLLTACVPHGPSKKELQSRRYVPMLRKYYA